MSSHLYNVGLALTLHNNVTRELARITTQMMGLSRLQGQVTGGFKAMHLAVLGVAGAFGTGVLSSELTKLIGKGNEWVRVTRNMTMAGVSSKDNWEAQAKAMELSSKYMNFSSTETLRIANDLRSVLGSQMLANEHLEPIIQAGAFLKAYQGRELGGHNAESLERELIAAMKSSEIAGKIAPEDMAMHIRQLTAMKIAYGDQVKVADYLKAQRAAGVALRGTNNSFRYGMFPAMVQEFGPGAGVMLMTAWNKIVAGVGNRTLSIQRMSELGLLDNSMVKYDKVGRAIGLKDPDAIKDNYQAAMHMGDWVMNTLKPLLDKATHNITDPNLRMLRETKLISGMFPDRKAAMQIVEILQQYNKFAKDAALQASAFKVLSGSATIRERFMTGGLGKTSIEKYLEGSWDYQVEAWGAQWEKFITHLGTPSVAKATAMLAEINGALSGAAKWASENPETAKAIVNSIAGFGSVLGGAAGIAILAAIGPTGWLIIGLGVLAAALIGLKPKIEEFLAPMESFLKRSGSWIEHATGIDRFSWADIKQMRASGMEPMPSAMNSALLDEFLNRRKAHAQGKLYHPSAWDGDTTGLLKKAAWEPTGRGSQAIQIHHATYLDKKVLSQSVTEYIVNASEHPTRSANWDGWSNYSPPDIQYSAT